MALHVLHALGFVVDRQLAVGLEDHRQIAADPTAKFRAAGKANLEEPSRPCRRGRRLPWVADSGA
jgi:hypothetical protein